MNPIEWENRIRQVFRRDNYTCQVCGLDCLKVRDNIVAHARSITNKRGKRKGIMCMSLKHGGWHVDFRLLKRQGVASPHHINGGGDALGNLQTLCTKCHMQLHNAQEAA
jgi:5-methylcytosine-specific restriction endonuclease McrA